ncbi:hypothetical protein Aglo01_34210 [Actinokineospora globicatena]|nr:hypothetical protein Aglo01_34210 [Actinokineospora globicatena]GLW86649.1 hypothetical protein Aglo02_42880 [Actinokineospora globicatena]
MCLDANPNTNYNGGTVYLWKCNGGNQQKWIYPNNGSSIQNVHSGRCLDVNPNTNYNGGTVYQWSCNGSPQQAWYF